MAGYANAQAFGTAAYDPTEVGWLWGDFNGDGTVDFETDYFIWLSGYAACQAAAPLPVAPGVVPEPTTLVLLGLGAVALLRRRKA